MPKIAEPEILNGVPYDEDLFNSLKIKFGDIPFLKPTRKHYWKKTGFIPRTVVYDSPFIIHEKPLNHWLILNDIRVNKLANEIGVSEAAVSRWVTGEAEPRGVYLTKLSDYILRTLIGETICECDIEKIMITLKEMFPCCSNIEVCSALEKVKEILLKKELENIKKTN